MGSPLAPAWGRPELRHFHPTSPTLIANEREVENEAVVESKMVALDQAGQPLGLRQRTEEVEAIVQRERRRDEDHEQDPDEVQRHPPS